MLRNTSDSGNGVAEVNTPIELDKSTKEAEETLISAAESVLNLLTNLKTSSSLQSDDAIDKVVNLLLQKVSVIDRLSKKAILEQEETQKTIESLDRHLDKRLKLILDTQDIAAHAQDSANASKAAMHLIYKEKLELSKVCQELRKKTKNLQDEINKIDKRKTKVIEKKEREIQQLKSREFVVKKDEEMEELRAGHQKDLLEKNAILEKVRTHLNDLEEMNKTLKNDKEKVQLAHSKLIQRKEKALEKLSKEKNLLEAKAKRADDLEKQLKEIQNEMAKKTEEVDKLRQANQKLIKKKDDQMEKQKKHHAESIKEKVKQIERLKVDNMQYFNDNKNLKSIISQKEGEEVVMKGDNKKLANEKLHLEKSIAQLREFTEKAQMAMAMRRSNLDKAPKQLSTSSGSAKAFGEKSSRPTIFGRTLKEFQTMRDDFDVASLLKQALKMKELLDSRPDHPMFHESIIKEYQEYVDSLKEYNRAIQTNIQLLQNVENHLQFAIPLPVFPRLSEHFIKEYYAEVEHQNEQRLKGVSNSNSSQERSCI